MYENCQSVQICVGRSDSLFRKRVRQTDKEIEREREGKREKDGGVGERKRERGR